MGIHNNSLIGAGGQQAFQITRSLRFRRNASAYFNRTPASAGNRTTWTWSGWVKRGSLSVSDLGGGIGVFGAGTLGAGISNFFMYFNSDNTIYLQETVNNVSNQLIYTTTPVFRDPSAWYHIIIAMDTTQATASNRVRVYVNGSLKSGSFGVTPSQNQALSMNNNVPQYIGGASVNPQAYGNVLSYFDGYMAELNFVEGYPTVGGTTYDATSWAALNVATLFGETDSITGVWEPKLYRGTYGTNGYYLKFTDNSSSLATTIGKDYSVNGNNWTPSAGISVAPGVTYDSMLDTPTPYDDGGQGRGNYCTLNPLAKPPQFPSLTEGSLRTGDTNVGNYHQSVGSTVAVNTGKWYWEITLNGTTYNSRSLGIAFASQLASSAATNQNGMWNTTSDLKDYRAILIANSTTVTPCRSIAGTVTTATNITLPSTLTGTSVFMVAIDVGAGAIWFGLDGVWLKSATTAEIIAGTTTNAVYTDIGSPSDFWTPAVYNYIGASSGYGFFANFGQRPFSYTPPTGFKTLNTQNLPVPTILNGANYMASTTYTGTGASLAITNTVNGISFQPDLVWTKSRSNTYSNHLEDVVRGVGQRLLSDSTAAEVTGLNGKLTSFDSNGFTQNGGVEVGASAATYVAFQWDAGTTTVTNTSGTISSQVRVNPTSGFSIVTYTGTGVNATVGHGLGVAPKMVIVKNRSVVASWLIWHTSFAGTEYILFDTSAKTSLAAMWNSTVPTSTVFNIGTNANTNASTNTYVAYCWSEVSGYSKIGTYLGNGNADGPFVYCGFRPRWIMIRSTSNLRDWLMYDTSSSNPNNTGTDGPLIAGGTDVTSYDGTGYTSFDILSNGFKPRAATTNLNASGETHMFMAFAENPFNNSLAR